jgi:restriction system protein
MNWRKANDKIFKDLMSHTYYKRLWVYFKRNKYTLPWEGNTWTLDLLPHSPKAALEVLNAYISVHKFISDHVVEGLFDAMAIIRAKYIGLPGTQSEKVAMLLDLSSRQFEHLTERLYYYMEYNTWLTAPTRDGGRDIIAKINDGAKREFLLVESKRYTGTVGVKRIRELYGVVNAEKANRGVLVTSGKFTRDAKKFADSNSIQLIDGDMFVRLLNEHLGADWTQKLDRFIAESELHYQSRGLGDAV